MSTLCCCCCAAGHFFKRQHQTTTSAQLRTSRAQTLMLVVLAHSHSAVVVVLLHTIHGVLWRLYPRPFLLCCWTKLLRVTSVAHGWLCPLLNRDGTNFLKPLRSATDRQIEGLRVNNNTHQRLCIYTYCDRVCRVALSTSRRGSGELSGAIFYRVIIDMETKFSLAGWSQSRPPSVLCA